MSNLPQTPHPQAQTNRHEEENPNQAEDTVTVAAIGEAAHEANRALQRILGDPVNPPWAEAGPHLRDSTLDGVRAILSGEVVAPEDSHINWLAFKHENGWVYGEFKNESLRTHPCMVPFEQLPKEQQIKDELFFSVVKAMESLVKR